MWSIGNHLLFYSPLLKRCRWGGAFRDSIFLFPSGQIATIRVCTHTTGPTTGRTVHHQPSYMVVVVAGRDTQIFIHHNRLVRSIIFAIAIRPLFFLLLLLPFWNFFFFFSSSKEKREKRDPPLIFECVRVCCHSRAPASPLWIFLWTRRRAIGSIFLGVVLLSLVRSLRTSAVPTHTQEGKRRRDTRVWPLFFFQKGAIQNGNDLRAEEEEAQNVSTPGQVRPRVKYRRRIIIWMGIDIALYSPGGFWRWWAWQSRHL